MSAVEECRTLVATVREEVRWAATAAYVPATRPMDEPRGAPLRLEAGDSVPGPRWEIGLGNGRARAALLRLGPALSRASAVVGVALAVEGVRRAPAPVRLPGQVALSGLLRALDVIERQLDLLGPGPHRRRTVDLLGSAAANLRAAASRLDRWQGPPAERPSDLCETCRARLRPRNRHGRIKGRECKTCETWRTRHGGEARPRSLDSDHVEPALAAAARRAERGEGWGWA